MPVLNCSCPNTQQDAIHGSGRRVFNKTAKENPITFRCTSCGNLKSKDGGVDPKKKKGK